MIVKIKTFSGETLYIPEEDYLNEVMYSDLEEREFGKTSVRYAKKLAKQSINEALRSAEKTGTPQLSKATQTRLIRANNRNINKALTTPSISAKGINKNSIRRLGRVTPTEFREALPEVNRQAQRANKYLINSINNAPNRNKAIAQARSTARDAIRTGSMFGL